VCIRGEFELGLLDCVRGELLVLPGQPDNIGDAAGWVDNLEVHHGPVVGIGSCTPPFLPPLQQRGNEFPTPAPKTSGWRNHVIEATSG